jgi:hypothetical protein
VIKRRRLALGTARDSASASATRGTRPFFGGDLDLHGTRDARTQDSSMFAARAIRESMAAGMAERSSE